MLLDRATAVARTAEELQKLIRFRTVNPPGQEKELAEHLYASFVGRGIESELIDTAPGRAAVVARIRGDGSARPVMLLAHTDVVGVDEASWSVGPFAGVIRDGYVYGRGAIDDKGMLAANMIAMQVLKEAVDRGELALARDVVFLASPDEEMSGEAGMEWLVGNRPDLFEVQYALNEGGRIRILEDGSLKLFVQHAEKTSHIVTITAHGVAGHAGVPRPDNSILRLSRALAAISDFASNPANGVSPTLLRAGDTFNVIPSESSATLNVRTLPGIELDSVIDELVRLIADPAVSVVVAYRGRSAPESPVESRMFDAIVEASRAIDPSIVCQPYLSSGVTDSAWLRSMGIETYGVLPFPLTPDEERRMHGADERVPMEALGFGTCLVLEIMRRIAALAR